MNAIFSKFYESQFLRSPTLSTSSWPLLLNSPEICISTWTRRPTPSTSWSCPPGPPVSTKVVFLPGCVYLAPLPQLHGAALLAFYIFPPTLPSQSSEPVLLAPPFQLPGAVLISLPFQTSGNLSLPPSSSSICQPGPTPSTSYLSQPSRPFPLALPFQLSETLPLAQLP